MPNDEPQILNLGASAKYTSGIATKFNIENRVIL